jgi:4-hydroxyphenylpyruvate dioxygenase
MFTAPYSSNASDASDTSAPFPHYNGQEAFDFICKHGQAVRAIGINVGDVEKSFNTLVERGAKPVTAPSRITDKSSLGYADYAEINIYGDVVLRLINTDNYEGRFFPNFADCEAVQKPTLLTSYQRDEGEGRESGAASELVDYGFVRFDHVVGNLWQLEPTLSQLKSITGFHDFAEFVAEDVGTVDSGLNSVVLANNNELILLPLNEPTYGTRRKSQIQTYLEQNQGEGVQHIAMFTKDIFKTMRHMRAASAWGGFEFQAPPNKQYYENLRNRLGDSLTDEQYRLIEELHILADKDDQGVLLQVQYAYLRDV